MTMLHPDLDRALYAELVPHRPTPADPHRMQDGPSAQWADLLLKRELWALASDAPDESLGAAS